MNKTFKIFRLVLPFFFTLSFHGFSQNTIDPYAETEYLNAKKENVVVSLNPEEINVLSGINALISSNLKREIKNYMYLWSSSINSGPYYFKWNAKARTREDYEVTAIFAGNDAKIILSCNGKTVQKEETQTDWSRISLGTVKLEKGLNQIEIKIEAEKGVKLAGIELTQPEAKEELMDEALGMRNEDDWFKDAGYGLMFQWTNRATPKKGDTIKNWEDKVNDFDVERFANMVEQSGAAYVLWSITWGQQYISAPIKSLDKVIEGRTTKRDLLGEMANLLHKKGIKLIFYYHYGYDCYHSKDSAWLQAAGGYKADKTELYQNISTILAEIGDRYKDKLNGWWFDGGQRYYDCHFDGSTGGILSAPFKKISQAARSGNGERVIAYNSWVLPRLTEYQNYFGGEGLKQYNDLDDGVFRNGKHKGLMAHSCFTLEKRWGHIDWNSAIASPKYTLEQMTERIKHAKKNRYPLSINLEMYEDGSVSPESIELLEKVRGVIRGNN